MTQREALEILKSGKNVFLTGQAGSGKTYLLNKYISFLRKKNVSVAVTASTGIASTYLNGSTIHSFSGIGVNGNLSEEFLKKTLKKGYLKKKIVKTKVLIIDEISMLSAFHFELVSEVVRRFKARWEPFGGIQIVLSGDFFQLPPIGNYENEKTKKFAYHSNIWKELNLKVCYLEEQHRQKDNIHINLLNSIRNNSIGEKEIDILRRRMNKNPQANEITKLYTHNIDVDTVNEKALSVINKKEKVFYMSSHGQERVVEILSRNCLASQVLSLKEGALVIFIKNNFTKGFVNGTLGRVIRFNREGHPVVRVSNGSIFVASPEKWSIEDEEGKRVAEVEQVPLRLAYAITVHKSQGMTLDMAEIDLSKCFEEGMGYVALSRVSSIENIYLKGFNEISLKVKEEVVEIDKEFRKISSSI